MPFTSSTAKSKSAPANTNQVQRQTVRGFGDPAIDKAKETDVQTQLNHATQFGHGVSQPIQRQAEPNLDEDEETLQRQAEPALEKDEEELPVQAKLTIGQPGDKYEQEADQMAAKVMAMPDSAVQREVMPEEDEELQAKPQLQREAMPEEEDETLQAKPQIQAKGTAPEAPANFDSQLAQQKGGGQLLSDETRAFMEPRFGADFSNVRVHETPDLANAIQAQAFTHGQDIYFNSGKYNPGSSGGKELLAHELTHVMQQSSADLSSSSIHSKPKSSAMRTKINKLRKIPDVETLLMLYATNEEPYSLGEDGYSAKDVRNEIRRRFRLKRNRGKKNHLEWFKKFTLKKIPNGNQDRKNWIIRATDYNIKLVPKNHLEHEQEPLKTNNNKKSSGEKWLSDLPFLFIVPVRGGKSALPKPEILYGSFQESSKTIDAVGRLANRHIKQYEDLPQNSKLRKERNSYRDLTKEELSKVLIKEYRMTIRGAVHRLMRGSLNKSLKKIRGHYKKLAKSATTTNISAEISQGYYKLFREENEKNIAEFQGREANISNAWVQGIREKIDFLTIPQFSSKTGAELRKVSIDSDRHASDLEPIPETLVGSSSAPPISKRVSDVLESLSRKTGIPIFRVTNYSGSKWHDTGFSVDVRLSGKRDDETGFFNHEAAKRFLIGLNQEISVIEGARWRTMYNDFKLAKEVNEATGARHVDFSGSHRGGRNLNWHGPAPLILHFHIDFHFPDLKKAEEFADPTNNF